MALLVTELQFSTHCFKSLPNGFKDSGTMSMFEKMKMNEFSYLL